MATRSLLSRWWWLGVGLSTALVAWGCGSRLEGGDDEMVPECTDGVDFDGDGYGEGCPAGPDCDDYDPTVNTNCPDANCGLGPAQGCPCDPQVDVPVSCYDGPPDTADNEPCRKGMRGCDPLTSTWEACGGQVLPEIEVCDYVDNDCDGQVDEGVQSACGNCMPGCDQTGVGTDPFPMPEDDPNVEAEGVGLNPDGDLTLDSSTYENHFLWVANDPEGTVSKLDTRTGCEVARYASVSHQSGVLIDHTGAGGATLPAWNAASPNRNRPSRTAVDFKNDMWVANRAHDQGGVQPSATKIWNLEEDCEDRNGNGQIDTSRDASGNCRIEISNPAEFFGEQDECIAMTVVLGAAGGIARAVAIDSGIEPGDPGDAWIGMFSEHAFYEVDGRTGAIEQRVPPAGSLPSSFSPYGAAIDSTGRLWATHSNSGAGTLISIDTAVNPAPVGAVVTLPALSANGAYGIAVDKEDRVWLGGWPEGMVKRYDPATGTTVQTLIPDNFGQGYGVRGVGVDTHGNVWAALHYNWGDGRVARIDADTATATGWWDIIGEIPVGVAVDFDGDVWTVNGNTSNASRMHIDQTTLQPAAHPATGNVIDTFATGPNPYTYSDFTGLGLRTVTRPSGDYAVPIKGCGDGEQAYWISVEWDATTPPSTRVEIWARVGDDLATLEDQPLYGPWTTSPADLQAAPGPVPDGEYLLLIIRLVSEDGESSPIVHAYSVQWACPGVPIP